MKKLILTTLILCISTGIFAAQKDYKVLPQNRAWSKELTKEEYLGVLMDDGSFGAVSENALRFEALYAWKAANREFRGLGLINFEGQKIIVVTDAPEGNGCYYYFNNYGQYLNAFCFSESGEGRWQEK